jgi:hypothetical protein
MLSPKEKESYGHSQYCQDAEGSDNNVARLSQFHPVTPKPIAGDHQ